MADAALVQAHLTILLRPISMMFLTLLLVGIVSGVLGGLILALLSTGFNLALGVSRVVNFQHGAVVLWSMYAAYVLWEATGINPYLGLLLIVPVAFAIGYFLHRWLIIRSLQTLKTARSCSPSDC